MATTILVVDDSATIRKLVVSILERNGYETVTAEDGEVALRVLDAMSVDLVLLDFVMPKMNGYQFCRELRARDDYSGLPVVLMSAKGDKIRGQVVQQTGAVDALTKPFDPRALLAVIETALRKHEQGPASEPEEEEIEEPAASRRIVPLSFEEVELSDDPHVRRVQIARSLAAGLSHAVVATVTEGGVGSFADRITSALLKHFTGDSLGKMSALLAKLDPGAEDTGFALAGDLSLVSIAEVLQMLELQRQTGALRITKGDGSISVYLGNGRVDLARGEGLPAAFRVGRYLVRDKVLTRSRLRRFLEGHDGENSLLGEALIREGRATEEQVRSALERQTSELIYESVRWKQGRFVFLVNDSCPEATLAQLGMAPGGLLMEGFRRVDEWQLIEDSFDFDDVLRKDETRIGRLSEANPLTEKERMVLRAINGKRTVREVIDEVAASNFEACKTLYQLINSRLVVRDAN